MGQERIIPGFPKNSREWIVGVIRTEGSLDAPQVTVRLRRAYEEEAVLAGSVLERPGRPTRPDIAVPADQAQLLAEAIGRLRPLMARPPRSRQVVGRIYTSAMVELLVAVDFTPNVTGVPFAVVQERSLDSPFVKKGGVWVQLDKAHLLIALAERLVAEVRRGAPAQVSTQEEEANPSGHDELGEANSDPFGPGSGIDAALADLRDEWVRRDGRTSDDLERLIRYHQLSELEAKWFTHLAFMEGLVQPEEGESPYAVADLAAQSSDALNLWIRSARRVDLLSPETVVELAQLFSKGRAATALLREGVADLSEIERLRAIEARGLWAREQLILGNLRLVRSIARRYRTPGLEEVDLCQAGVFGLMRAAELFDWTRGFQFSTYATQWIRQSIGRYRDDFSQLVRFPVYMRGAVRKAAREVRALEADESLHFDEGQFLAKTGIQYSEFERLQKLQRLLPLDTVQGEAGSEDLVQVASSLDLEEMAADLLEREQLRGWLQYLPRKHEAVLLRRFGLGNYEPMTLQAIGDEFGVSRERIRQIEADALAQLRDIAGTQARKGST